jgi:glycosyltransferase involved in cell wall biosynthesis
MNVVCLTKRWQHHTASGGYDRLAREVGATVVQRNEVSGLSQRLLRRLWTISARDHLRLLNYRYEYEDLLAEGRLLAKARFRRPDVVHVLYGDEQLDLLLRLRRLLPSPLVASFHLPTFAVRDRLERVHKHLLTGINAAIVVSQCQLNDFRSWFGRDKVVYVPHGIDTGRFCPSEHQPRRKSVRLLIVGHHMRDWQATHRIIDECNARKLPVEVDVVLGKKWWPVFTGCENIRLHSGISEDELIGLYQQADTLLVPVVDSTANNAVLEALACGTPVISNAVGGIPDYVDETCGWLFDKGEISGIVALIDQLCSDRGTASTLRESARLKSLEFSWERIAEQLFDVYRAVGRGDSPAEALAVRQQAPCLTLSGPAA